MEFILHILLIPVYFQGLMVISTQKVVIRNADCFEFYVNGPIKANPSTLLTGLLTLPLSQELCIAGKSTWSLFHYRGNAIIYIYIPAILSCCPSRSWVMIYKDAKVLAQMLHSFGVLALQCDGLVLRCTGAPTQVAHDTRLVPADSGLC